MTFKERKDKLIELKMEISKIRAEQNRQKNNKKIDLAVGLSSLAASVVSLEMFKANPDEIAYLITTGALYVSSVISYINYKNFDYTMAYYDDEVEDLNQEITRTLK